MSVLSSKRQWFRTSEARPGEKALRVLDLNCLAPSLVEPVRYKDCDASCLDANTRVRAIKNELKFFDPDIVCLQELEWVDYKNLTHAKTYQGCYQQHTPSRRIDGTAILWKSDQFNLLHSETIAPLPSSPFDRHLRSAAVVLSSQSDSHKLKKYVVVSSHLVFNCGRSDVKFYQIAFIAAAIQNLKLKHSKLEKSISIDNVTLQKCLDTPAIIWCGDFNMTPMSPMYSALLTRVPDGALEKVAADALASETRCVSQKLLSGQHALFFTEARQPRLCNDLSLRDILNHELKFRPIRKKRAYLGNSVASVVHTRLPPQPHNMIRTWIRNTGPPIDAWTSSCFMTAPASESLNSLTQKLSLRDPNHWICPINLKSAQCLRNATFAGEDPILFEPCYTAFHKEQSGCIDFVWYSPDQLSVIGICAQAVTPKTHQTPSRDYPVSDHLPIVVEFKKWDYRAESNRVEWFVRWKFPNEKFNNSKGRLRQKFDALMLEEYVDWYNHEVHNVQDFSVAVRTPSGQSGGVNQLSSRTPTIVDKKCNRPSQACRYMESRATHGSDNMGRGKRGAKKRNWSTEVATKFRNEET